MEIKKPNKKDLSEVISARLEPSRFTYFGAIAARSVFPSVTFAPVNSLHILDIASAGLATF